MALSAPFVALVLLVPACTPAGKGTTAPQKPAGTKVRPLPPGVPNLPPLVATVSDEEEAQRELTQKTHDLLVARNYDGLEDLAEECRKTKATFPSGTWRLRIFYWGLSHVDKRAPESDWEATVAEERAWVGARPASATAHVALMNTLVEYAWRARGDGFADSVTPEGWALFRERLATAHAVFDEARKRPAKCPELWAVAQTLALGEQWDDAHYWALFHAATKVEPTYPGFYEGAVQWLQPRWNGEPGEAAKFAERVADEMGGDDGDMLYADLVSFAKFMGFYKNVFSDSGLSWKRAKRGFEVRISRNPDSLRVASRYLLLAAQAGDVECGKRLVERIGGRVDLGVWNDLGAYAESRRWAYMSPGLPQDEEKAGA